MTTFKTFTSRRFLMAAAMLSSLVVFSSCEKTPEKEPDPEYPEIAIEQDHVTIIAGESAEIAITEGSGKYIAESEDETIATASVTGEDGKTVTINAIEKGETTVTVSDTLSQKQASISVTVADLISLSTDNISVELNETAEVEILTGSGDYSVSFENPEIASAAINDNIITVTATGEGTTKMSVKDNATDRTAYVNVEVTFNPYMTLHTIYPYGDLTFIIDAPEEYRDRIWIDLNNDGEMQDNEKVTVFGEEAKYTFNNDITIYGPVTMFDCTMMQIDEMDITHNPYITELICLGNKLQSLDLSNCPELTRLDISNNVISSLDLSKCPKLQKISCNEANFTVLDVSNNPELKEIACIMTKVTTINFGNISKIERLNIWNNEISSINLSNFSELNFLNIAGNQLTDIDVSKNTKLQEFSVSGNHFTKEIDLSNNTELTSILAYDCDLKSAEFLNTVPNPEKVTRIMINNNTGIKTADFSKFTSATEIHCEQCDISGDNMQSLIESLPDRTGAASAKIYLVDRGPFAPHQEKNSATVAQIDIAKGKNWKTYDVYSGAGEMPYNGI